MALVTRHLMPQYVSLSELRVLTCCQKFLVGGGSRQAGFGVGVFEEEDDSVYTEEDMNSYDRYHHHIARWTHGLGRRVSGPERGRRNRFEASGDEFGMSFIQRSISGFKLSSNQQLPRKVLDSIPWSPLTLKQVYPPPELPPDFNPMKTFDTPGPAYTKHAGRNICTDRGPNYQIVPGKVNANNPRGVNYPLTSHQRAVMLGEKPPLPPPSMSAPPMPPPSGPPKPPPGSRKVCISIRQPPG